MTIEDVRSDVERRAAAVFGPCQVLRQGSIVVLHIRRADDCFQYSRQFDAPDLHHIPVEYLARAFVLDAAKGLMQ